MKIKPFLLMLLVFLLGDTCFFHHTFPPTRSPELTSPTANPKPAASPTAGVPEGTPTPAAVQPGLSTNGPYLAYLRDSANGPEIVLMDANGKGELSASFPMDLNASLPQLLSALLSPTGDWLAFYTGSAGPAFMQTGPEASDLTLKLMDLLSTKMAPGDSQLVTRLLSADYPANFAAAASQLGMPGVTAQSLRDAFTSGITESAAWSPDGSMLAFAGQMDGLSSDLYIYNAGSGAIQRLSSGAEEVQWIKWSPDGKWILDGSSYLVGEGMTYDVYATSPDGKVSRKLLSDYRLPTAVTWLNGSEFLTFQSANGPGTYGLVRVNFETGTIDNIYQDPFGDFLADPQGKWVVVLSQAGDELYLFNLATLEQTTVNLPGAVHGVGADSNLSAMAAGADRHFILKPDSGQEWYYLSTSGKLTDAGINAERVSIGPDQQEWIVVKNDIQVFSNSSTRTRVFALPAGMAAGDVQMIIWRPDSSGIFLVSTSSQLYALDFSSGDSELVESALATTGPAGLIWVH